jgi:hypothetical protein
VVVTLDTGIVFRAALGSGDARESCSSSATARTFPPVEGVRGSARVGAPFSNKTNARLPDFLADVKVGVHALDLRGASPRVSLEARLAGPVLLDEACALPLAVVSTGDAMDAAELSFGAREDPAGEGAGAFEVEVTRDGDAPLGPNATISIGRIAPGLAWRGVVYVRRRTLGPPVTLVVALRGASVGKEFPNDVYARTELETEVEVAVRAPFTWTREITSTYRTHALSFEGDDVIETTRVLTTLRVGAASSRLLITGAVAEDDAVRSFPALGGSPPDLDFSPVALGEGDEFVHVVASTRDAPAPALEITWRRAESSANPPHASMKDALTVIPAVPAPLDESKTDSKTDSKPPPVTASLVAPSRVRVGVPFAMRVRLRNDTPEFQRFRVKVVDASGFVFSGSRDFVASAAPRSVAEHTFSVAALRSGEWCLPELEMTALRFDARCRPPKCARVVYVEP